MSWIWDEEPSENCVWEAHGEFVGFESGFWLEREADGRFILNGGEYAIRLTPESAKALREALSFSKD